MRQYVAVRDEFDVGGPYPLASQLPGLAALAAKLVEMEASLEAAKKPADRILPKRFLVSPEGAVVRLCVARNVRSDAHVDARFRIPDDDLRLS